MNRSVLIIEDCHDTGCLLLGYINLELARLVEPFNPYFEPRNPLTAFPFKNGADEPGQGQLAQLRGIFRHLEAEARANAIDAGGQAAPWMNYPTAHLFPQDHSMTELKHQAAQFHPKLGREVEDDREANRLREIVYRVCTPDVLMVDLVLDDEDRKAMEPDGLQVFRHDEPRSLADPRPQLRELTSFKLLRAFSHSTPVIMTSFLSNPLIRQHCIVNGAVAFVTKPVPSKDEKSHADFASVEPDAGVREMSAKMNANVLDVVVTGYLTEAVAEVVKALTIRWVSEVEPL